MCFKERNMLSGFEGSGKDGQTRESALLHLQITHASTTLSLPLFLFFVFPSWLCSSSLLFISLSPYFLPLVLRLVFSVAVIIFFIFPFLPFLLSPFIQFDYVGFCLGSRR
jgi:hypothetical protein